MNAFVSVDGYEFNRSEGFVTITTTATNGDALVRISIPIETWNKAVWNLISMREVLAHDLVYNTTLAERLRSGS